MGSLISSTLAGIYLQYFEELMAKHWMVTGEITCYRRYVDDIIIIFGKNKVTEDSITSYMNNIHKHLELKQTDEENRNINYLDLSIHRGNNNLQVGIYRKPLQTHTITHFTSKHPLEQELATYKFYIKRMLSTPIREQARQQEWTLSVPQLGIMVFHYRSSTL